MSELKDKFAGKVAVVTGAASGIALAITKRLLAEGAEEFGRWPARCGLVFFTAASPT